MASILIPLQGKRKGKGRGKPKKITAKNKNMQAGEKQEKEEGKKKKLVELKDGLHPKGLDSIRYHSKGFPSKGL